MLSRMRILSNDQLLLREAQWLRNVASRTRWYAQAFPDLGDRERREVGSGSGSVEWSRRVSEPLPNRMRSELG